MKQVIIVNNSLKMGKGKICSQVAHASLGAFLTANKELSTIWLMTGAKKVVLKASEEELLKIYEKIKGKMPHYLVRDKGLTQVKENSITALAIGPEREEEIDKYTSHLKLL